ncbi:MFS transporter [Paenibacillus sp. P96]|uniref:MFS transporter n=1 Tax=Paenibacillus zeirhizosphaerae TaxID=2987519 RepID=A0ABT9FSP3_9BACL|nr:MFS transporter [Paenibacillus sp. P96]MDP4097726.1 MFS transporter [Paenibacillus sp. P96]
MNGTRGRGRWLPDGRPLRGRHISHIQHNEQNKEKSSKGGDKRKEYTALASVPLVLVLGNSMLVPILPELQSKLHISQFQSSLVISVFSIAAGIIIPISGYLSDRFSRKAVLIPSLILYGSAGILAGMGAVWNSYTILMSGRVLQGMGAAGTSAIAMALVGDMYKDGTESQALGLIEAANAGGKVLSPVLGSLLALIVWYASFFAFPVFCLLSLLAIIFLIHEPKNKRPSVPIGEYVRNILNVLKQKGRWLLSSFFTGAVGLFILFGVLFYLSDKLEEPPYDIDGVMKGLILAIPLLGMVTTSFITGSKIKKNGVVIRRLTMTGLLTMAVSEAVAIFTDENIYLLIGLLTLGSIGTGLLLPCLNTMITGSVEKNQRGMITSLYNSLRFLGVAFGPPLFGWLMGISHAAVFGTVAVLSLLTFFLAFKLIKPSATVQ